MLNSKNAALWYLRAASFTQLIGMGIFYSFQGFFMKEARIPESVMGTILAVGSILNILASPIWGKWADHSKKYKEIIIVGTVVVAVTVAFLGFARTVFEFTVVGIVSGMLLPAVVAIMPALAIQNLGQKKKGQGFGSYRSFGSLGYMVGTIALPFLLKKPEYITLAAGAILVTSILPISKLENPVAYHKDKIELNIRKLPPALLFFLAAMFFNYLAEPGLQSFLAAYAQTLKADLQLVGLLSGFTGLMAMLSLPWMGRLVDKKGTGLIMLLAFAANPLRLLITSLIPNPYFLWVPHLLHVIGWAGREVATVVFLTKIVGDKNKATVLSIALVVRTLGMTVGSFAMGMLAENLGYVSMFRIMAVCSMAGFALTLLVVSKKNREHHTAEVTE